MGSTQEWALVSTEGSYPLPPTMAFIGREDCDITVKSRSIEKRHAVLTYDHYHSLFRVKDLSSLNGTFVNESRIAEQEYMDLHHGDSLRLAYDSPTFRMQHSSRSPVKFLERPKAESDQNSGSFSPVCVTDLAVGEVTPPQGSTPYTPTPPQRSTLHTPTWERASKEQVMAECQGCIKEQHIKHTCESTADHYHRKHWDDLGTRSGSSGSPDLDLHQGHSCGHARTRRSPSTQSLSPERQTGSPSRRSMSPNRRSVSPNRRSISPCQRSISPVRGNISPHRFSPARPKSDSPLVEKRPLSPLRSPLFDTAISTTLPPAPVGKDLIQSVESKSSDDVLTSNDGSQEITQETFTTYSISPISFQKTKNLTKPRLMGIASPLKSASLTNMTSRGTPLYGQPDWWGESEDISTNGEPGTKPRKSPPTQAEVKDTQAEVKDAPPSGSRQERPQEEQTESGTMKNPDHLEGPSTAFTVALEGSAEDPSQINIGGSLSHFLPPHIRKNFEKKAAEKQPSSPSKTKDQSPSIKRSQKCSTLKGSTERLFRGKTNSPDLSDNRTALKTNSLKRNVTKKPPSGKVIERPHIPPPLSTENVEQADKNSPLGAQYLISKMFETSGSPAAMNDDDGDDYATESSLYAEAAEHRRMRRAFTMPEITYSTGEPQTHTVVMETADDKTDKVSESGTYTIDCDNNELDSEENGDGPQPRRSPSAGSLDGSASEDSLEKGHRVKQSISSMAVQAGSSVAGAFSDAEVDKERELTIADVAGLSYAEDTFDDIFYAKQKKAGTFTQLQTLPDNISVSSGQDSTLDPTVNNNNNDTPTRRPKKDATVPKDQLLQELGLGEPVVADANQNRPQLVEELLSSRKYHKEDDPIIVNKTDFFKKIQQSQLTAAAEKIESSKASKLNSSNDSALKRQSSDSVVVSARKSPSVMKSVAESISTDVLLQNTDDFMSSLQAKGKSVRTRQSNSSTPHTTAEEIMKNSINARISRTDKQANSNSRLTEPPRSSTLPRDKGRSGVMSKSYGETSTYNSRSNKTSHQMNSKKSPSSASNASTPRKPQSRSNSVERRNSANSRDLANLVMSGPSKYESPLTSHNDSLRRTSGSNKGIPTSSSSSARPNRTFELRRARNDSSSTATTARSSASSAASSTPRKSARTHSAERSEVSLGAKIVAKSRENNTPKSSSTAGFKRNDGGRHSLRVTGTSTGTSINKSQSKSTSKPSAAESSRAAEKKAWQRRKSYDPRRAVAEAKAKKEVNQMSDNEEVTSDYEHSDVIPTNNKHMPLKSSGTNGVAIGQGSMDVNQDKELEIAMFSSDMAKDLELLSRADEELAALDSVVNQTRRAVGAESDRSTEIQSPLQLINESPVSKDKFINPLSLSKQQAFQDPTSSNSKAAAAFNGKHSEKPLAAHDILRLSKKVAQVRECKSPASGANSTEVMDTLVSGHAPSLGATTTSPLGHSEEVIQTIFKKSAFSSFSDQSMSPPNSPALSPIRARFSHSQPRLSSSGSVSPKTPAGIASSEQQLSIKLKASTSRTRSQVSAKSPELSDTPSPTDDVLLNQEVDFPASQELAEILRTLRVVDHNVKVLERHVYNQKSDSKSSVTDLSSNVVADDQGQYLAEIKRIRNEIAGFKPIEPSPAGGKKGLSSGTKPTTKTSTSSTKTLSYLTQKKAYY